MISCHQLTFRYASGPELAFADLEVEQGATLLLTGASGSGKSTWLALAAGLLPTSSGHMTVAGQALNQLSKINSDAWRARTIGFLPQKLHLSAALTVHDNLELAQWAAGQTTDNSRIAEALTALGVQDLSKRKPSQLSGGQAQRLKATLVIATHDSRVKKHLEAVSRPFLGIKLDPIPMNTCASSYRNNSDIVGNPPA